MKTQIEWLEYLKQAVVNNEEIDYFGTKTSIWAYEKNGGPCLYFGRPTAINHLFKLTNGNEILIQLPNNL